MEKTIFLSEVLKIIHLKDEEGNPVKFDVEIREFSRQNKTGGKYRVYNDACLLTAKSVKGKSGLQKIIEDRTKKNPRHWENRTRNIELANGEIKKISTLFIIRFNGMEVLY